VIFYCIGYLYHFQHALAKIPSTPPGTVVYRGIDNSKIIAQHYTFGRKVHWRAYSSTTSNLTKASDFAGDNGVVLKMTVSTGKSIKDYSQFPTEDEILLSPNMELVVSRAMYVDGLQRFVELTQILSGSTFVF